MKHIIVLDYYSHKRRNEKKMKQKEREIGKTEGWEWGRQAPRMVENWQRVSSKLSRIGGEGIVYRELVAYV